MRIAIASDHAGFALKEVIREALKDHEVEDLGPFDTNPVDYPRTAFAVARAVAQGRCERGILVCGSGIGMSITANRVKGIRAALCVNAEYAELARRHNDANVLCLPGRFMADHHALKIVELWLSTEFEGGRHAKRTAMMDESIGS
jgi:ribose 5-phosphate isomerase B